MRIEKKPWRPEKLIVEPAKDCSLVQKGYEENGHDCWGNLEWSSYYYVIINGQKEKFYSEYNLVIHDGKNVYDVTFDLVLKSHLEDAEKLFKRRMQDLDDDMN